MLHTLSTLPTCFQLWTTMIGGFFRQCQNSLHDGNGSSVLIGCEYRTYEGTSMSLYNSYCGRCPLPVMTVFHPSSFAGWFDATVGLVARATSDLPRSPPYLLCICQTPIIITTRHSCNGGRAGRIGKRPAPDEPRVGDASLRSGRYCGCFISLPYRYPDTTSSAIV